jgi:predicted DNA-binding transcriptional regulator YafY
MNRTDRLLAIVLERQGEGHQRAEDLTKTFESGTRTIYRDMLALLSFPSGNKHESQGENR